MQSGVSARPHVGDHTAREHDRVSDLPHVGDHATREPTPRRINAVVAAMRRLLGGRAVHASLARKARELVLGVPALDADARAARLAAAGVMLGLASRDVEQVLWADLPNERPIGVGSDPPVEPAVDVDARADRDPAVGRERIELLRRGRVVLGSDVL